MSILNSPRFGHLLSRSIAAGHGVCVVEQELTLYDEPCHLIAAMVADIQVARKRVWLESFSIADDAAGKTVVAALIERAKAGVDVRVIYDTIGSIATPYLLFDELLAAGVQVHSFRSIRAAFGPLAVPADSQPARPSQVAGDR